MTDDRKEDAQPVQPPGLRVLHCRRTGQDYEVAEHERCPYCFGEGAEVESGEYERFCDFEPGKDPVTFGFPGTSSRDLHG